MELYKRAFFDDGFTGIIFLLAGLLLQFDDTMPYLVWGLLSLVSAALVIVILAMKIRARKELREPLDETAKTHVLHAEALMYRLILVFLLMGALLMQFVFKNKIQVVLNWNICLIFLGCCNLIYSLILRFAKNGNKVKEEASCLEE